MKLVECYKWIERYMTSSDRYPRLVNVDNPTDMNALRSHFQVGTTKFISVERFIKPDNGIAEAKMIDFFCKETGCIFLTGLTSFYKLLGEERCKQILNRFVCTTYKAKIVILCYQCASELTFSDERAKQRVYRIEGTGSTAPRTTLVFCDSLLPDAAPYVKGVHKIAEYLEQNDTTTLFVQTQRTKADFPNALFLIREQGNAYQQLCMLDSDVANVAEQAGSDAQWRYALEALKDVKSLRFYTTHTFVSVESLDLVFDSWDQFDANQKWMYFLALRCYGVPKNAYLDMAVKRSETVDQLIPNVYNTLLDISFTEADFGTYYQKRKALLKRLGEQPMRYISDYCQWSRSKGKDAIYYLTDRTETEIHLIFNILYEYREQFEKREVMDALEKVYPALYCYLQPYDFKNDLLNLYFDEYKYQKVMNDVKPEFLELVEEQAVKREYNVLLPARWEKTEHIADANTLVYFVDAMGVEYLSFLLTKCKENNLLATVTVCHSEIPSLTCYNKDFVEVFRAAGARFANGESGYKKLDTWKHHGEETVADYRNEALPIYLETELNLLNDLMQDIAKNLQLGNCEKVIMISDHGASRLAVISQQALSYEMSVKGVHSGRCCPIAETDTQPACAIEGVDHWVIADYGRFRGGRQANVEVHGGATLEEVTVPIIEIIRKEENYEFKLESTEITFSRRKKDAKIRLFSKSKLRTLTIVIPKLDIKLDVVSNDSHNFEIALPDLKKAGEYTLEIYLHDNLLSNDLKFRAKNKDFGMNDKFKL